MDTLHTGLDIIGTFDPSPLSDGLNAAIYALEGDGKNAAISLAGIMPYLGDAAKVGKYALKAAKASDIIQSGGHTLKPSTLKKLGISKEPESVKVSA